MTPLVLSLIFGLALAAPFMCVAWWASKVHSRQVAHYECRLHALSRDCALKQEVIDRRGRADEEAWEARVARFWAEQDAAKAAARAKGGAR